MKFDIPTSPETKRETLETIMLAEYHELPLETQEWLHRNEDVPEVVWEKLKNIDPKKSLHEVLQAIQAAVAKAVEGKAPIKPDGLEISRFTSFEDVIKHNLSSCGARARIYGTTLRKLGIPVKFIDGKHQEGDKITDHAWLEIYAPKGKTWIECDPGEKDFGQHQGNKKERTFHDWEELEVLQIQEKAQKRLWLRGQFLTDRMTAREFLKGIRALDQSSPFRKEAGRNVDLLTELEVMSKLEKEEEAQLDYQNLLSLSHFHVGQRLADKNPEAALPSFLAALAAADRIEDEEFEGWRQYVRATIAYLQKDLASLEKTYAALEEDAYKPVTGNLLNGLKLHGDVNYERDYHK